MTNVTLVGVVIVQPIDSYGIYVDSVYTASSMEEMATTLFPTIWSYWEEVSWVEYPLVAYAVIDALGPVNQDPVRAQTLLNYLHEASKAGKSVDELVGISNDDRLFVLQAFVAAHNYVAASDALSDVITPVQVVIRKPNNHNLTP